VFALSHFTEDVVLNASGFYEYFASRIFD